MAEIAELNRRSPLMDVSDHSWALGIFVEAFVRMLVLRGIVAEQDLLELVDGLSAGVANGNATPAQISAMREQAARVRRLLAAPW